MSKYVAERRCVVVMIALLCGAARGGAQESSVSQAAWECVTTEAAFSPRDTAEDLVYDDVWRSEDGATWERVLEHAPWSPRVWFISKEYAGRIWIIGGFDNVNGANLGDVWHTKDGKTWEQLVAEPTFAPRHEATCYVYDNSLWVVAGNTWPVVNDVGRLKMGTVTY